MAASDPQRNKDKAMIALADSYHDFAKGTRCGISGLKDAIKDKGFPTLFRRPGSTDNKDDNELTFADATAPHRSTYFHDPKTYNLVGVAKGDNVEATMMNYVNTHYFVDLEENFIPENVFNPPDTPSGMQIDDNSKDMQAKVFKMMGMMEADRKVGNIGIIYDQCAMTGVIPKLTTDYVTLVNKSDKGHIFNINPICGRWDEAPKTQVNRIDVSINVKHENPSYVYIQHTRNIRFNLKSDLSLIGIASSGTLVPDNYVELFYETGTDAGVGRDGISRNPNVFYLQTLTKKPFNFGVAELCNAYNTAPLNIQKAMQIVLNDNKLQSFGNTNFREEVQNFFTTQGVFAPDQMNFLNIKRSADYGQIYLVQKLNKVGSANIEMYAYNLFNKDKKIHKTGNYPASMKLQDKLINKWVLLTGDKLCYARARLEGVPCIFYKAGKGLEIYAGSAVAATSSGPAFDDKMTNIINFLTEFKTVIEKIIKSAPTPSTPSTPSITFLSNRLQQIQRENQHINTHSTSYHAKLRDLLSEFTKVTKLIFDIQQLKSKFKFNPAEYLTTIQQTIDISTTYEDDVLITHLRAYDDELNAIIAYYNHNKQTTLLGITNCLSFSECSLFKDVLSIELDKMVLTRGEDMSDEFVKQWHTLNIFSPIIRKGKIHDFVLNSELGTEMRRLLLSDRIRTVDALITELSVLMKKPSRQSRTIITVGDVKLYNPLECATYVLCKEIEKGTEEITSLIEKLVVLEDEELTILYNKLLRQSSLSEPQRPGTPQGSYVFSYRGSPGSSPGSSTDPFDAMTNNQDMRRNWLTLPPGQLTQPPGQLTQPPGQQGGALDNPSYFCLNTYFSQSDYYLYSYVSHDDIIELQHVVNFIFYICDVNINTHRYDYLITEFEELYNATPGQAPEIEANFYGMKERVYVSIKKVLIHMLTQIIFNYGWAKFVTEANSFISPYASIYDYFDNNFMSEIRQRIVNVPLRNNLISTINKKTWNTIFTKPTIELVATQDIIDKHYLLDSVSKKVLRDLKYEVNIARILYTHGRENSKIKQFILLEIQQLHNVPQQGSKRSVSDVSSVEAPPTIDGDGVMSKLGALDNEFYITEYSRLYLDLHDLLRKSTERDIQEIQLLIHCIHFTTQAIINLSTDGIQMVRAYYQIVHRYNELLKQPQVAGKAKSIKTIAKFRLQDYHKKYYPLYYQTYYGNENGKR